MRFCWRSSMKSEVVGFRVGDARDRGDRIGVSACGPRASTTRETPRRSREIRTSRSGNVLSSSASLFSVISSVPGCRRQPPRDLNRALVGHALRMHELDELLTGEAACGVKHSDVQILVERDPALFPVGQRLPRGATRSPPSRERIASTARSRCSWSQPLVPRTPPMSKKMCLIVVHAISTARAGAPSQPSMRSGRQMSWYSPGGGTERSSPSTNDHRFPSSVRCVRW